MFTFVALSVSNALALSCAYGPQLMLPGFDAEGVPINVKPTLEIINGSLAEFTIVLTETASGEIVESSFEVIEQGTNTFVRLLPGENLAPNTAYELSVADQDWPISSFTTGQHADDAPEVTGGIIDIAGEASKSTWGTERFVRMEFNESAYTGPVIYELEATVEGEVHQIYTPNTFVWFGDGLCTQTVALERGDSVSVRARAIDAAGNVGGWVGPDETVVRQQLSCASSSPVSFGWMSIAALGLLISRRRQGVD